MPRANTSVLNLRDLELRAGLFFQYPQFEATDKTLLFFLPFWENPEITEMKEANLVEYDLINRGSTMFVNTGAKARSLTIEFPLTINHIMRSYNSVLSAKALIQSVFTKSEKERFDIREKPSTESISPTNQVTRQWKENLLNSMADAGVEDIKGARSDLDKVNYWRQTDPDIMEDYFVLGDNSYERIQGTAGDISVEDFEGTASRALAYETFRNNNGMSETAVKALDSLSFILDIIRTSVAPNQQNTVLGPPLIRVRHGTMYLDVPCICKNFNIRIEEEAGYNLRTLTPNRITVTMTLVEVRTGDFGTFHPTVPVQRDNIAGWESTLEHGTTDPGLIRG
tara:strand:+ start:384 stop:1400 length:1017 start_codon:yes stop_codon:yes gene_type:complete